MTKYNLLLGVIFLFCGLNLSAQNRWEDENKRAFIEQCRKHTDETMGVSKSVRYCVCMLEKIRAIESDPVKADLLPASTIETLAYGCLDANGDWSDETIESFLVSCERAGATLDDPPQYCNCMVQKLIRLFPNPDDFNLSEEEIGYLAETCLF